MEKLKSVLVTDRTQADVNVRNGKGTYNDADLNRVLRACAWLAGRLERYGYSVEGEYFPAALVRITPEPQKAGDVSGVLAYKGETVVLKAAGKSSYEFNHWEENGVTVSESPEYSFPAEQDRELVAVFDAPLEESGLVGFAVVGRAIVGREV